MKEKFGRWNILFNQYLKRDWKKISIWILGLGLFASTLIPAFEEIAKAGGLLGMYETLQNPAMISIIGPTPVNVASDYNLGAMYSHEMLLFSGLFAMIISILHLIGHSRKEEDLGLTELIRSFHVGRQANSLALMIETILINIVLGLFIAGVMLSFRAETITVEGAILFGLSIAMAGIIGAGIGLLMSQLMPVSSAATGSSLALVGLLYIVRGMTDISNIKLSIFNPLGWTYLTFPFTENNWKPLIFALLFTLFLVIIAIVLEGGRDMGAGYLPQRQGRAYAKKSLLSVAGLLARLNKLMIISWLMSFLILAAAYGAIYGDMGSFLQDNEILQQIFTYSGTSIEESFTSVVMLVMVDLVTILPIALVNGLFSQERSLYLSQIYGTKVRRKELYWTNMVFAVLSAVAGVFLSATGLGLAALTVMEDGSMSLLDFYAIAFSLLPSALFFTSLAALILGWIPRLGKIVYGYLAYSFFLNYFGRILDLPDWFMKTAPQTWLAKIPLEDFDIKVFTMMMVISIILTVLGYLFYKNRDMVEGS